MRKSGYKYIIFLFSILILSYHSEVVSYGQNPENNTTSLTSGLDFNVKNEMVEKEPTIQQINSFLSEKVNELRRHVTDHGYISLLDRIDSRFSRFLDSNLNKSVTSNVLSRRRI